MKKALRILVPAVAWLAAALLSAEPKMPDGFTATWTDPSGLTWRETGSMPMPLGEALAALKAMMKSQGYTLRHDITGAAFGDRHLFLWVKGCEEVTVMVWPDGEKNTCISWGVTDIGQNSNLITNTLQKTITDEKGN